MQKREKSPRHLHEVHAAVNCIGYQPQGFRHVACHHLVR